MAASDTASVISNRCGLVGARGVQEAPDPLAQLGQRGGVGRQRAAPAIRPSGGSGRSASSATSSLGRLPPSSPPRIWSHTSPSSPPAMPGHGGQLGQPVVERGVAPLDQAVGVQEQRAAALDRGLGLAGRRCRTCPAAPTARPRGSAARARARSPARAGARRWRTRPGRCRGPAAGRARWPSARAPSFISSRFRRASVSAGRRAQQRVGAERGAQLAHDHRGAQPVADHVAHHHRHAAVVQLDRVVPVAADRGAGGWRAGSARPAAGPRSWAGSRAAASAGASRRPRGRAGRPR